MDLQTQLQELKTSTQAKLAEMRGEHSKELQELRVAVLGKKGSLTDLLKGLKDLPNEERPKVGKMVNEVRDVLTEAFDEAAKIVEAAKIQAQLDSESLDVTLPGRQVKLGNRHILSQTAEEIEDIFLGMGFQVVDGFEVETDYYNFERMNLPKDHPARDMQDTFYITEEILMRTHTSPVQARTLDKHDFSKGPLKMISPGRVFRRDKGCNVCKKTGWIEILGAGMVHPQVLEMSGVDSEEYSGFAFGLGQERIAMLRYGINDIRGFYQGDVRFSKQFK